MKEKELSEIDRNRCKTYKLFWQQYLKDEAPTLSTNSIKLYARCLGLVSVHLLDKKNKTITIKKFLNVIKKK